jgi:hypothetical protein
MKRVNVLAGVLMGACCTVALAKLPPPSDAAKAAAAERVAKADHANKVGAYELCQVQNKVAARYLAEAGRSMQPTPTPACAEAGPFVYTPAAKPVEAAGAHSPAATAVAPPSGTMAKDAPTPAK